MMCQESDMCIKKIELGDSGFFENELDDMVKDSISLLNRKIIKQIIKNGSNSKKIDIVLDRKARRNIEKSYPVTWDDI